MKKRVLAVLVSVAVIFTMSFGMTCTAFAGNASIDKTSSDRSTISSISNGTYSVSLSRAATFYLYGEANSSVTVTSPNGSTSRIYLGSDGYGGNYYNVAGNYIISGAIDPEKSVIAYAPKKNQKLKAGKKYLFGNSGSTANTFTFKATKTGYLKIQKDNELSAKFTLWKGKKKVANADPAYSSTGALYYGVTKGKTYKIKLAPSYMGDYCYAIKLVNGKVRETSGSKQSKARSMKKKKTYKGTIQAGSAAADWYKFKPKKTNSQLTIKGYTGSSLKVMYFCKGSGSTYKYTRTIYAPSQSGTISLYNTSKSATWYVKVYRSNKYSSGYYTLKWK